MSPTVIDVTTPNGVGRLHADVPDAPRAIALLGGGASGVITSGDLVALASGLPGRGVGVIRFEQPWRVAGKKIGRGRPCRTRTSRQRWTPSPPAGPGRRSWAAAGRPGPASPAAPTAPGNPASSL